MNLNLNINNECNHNKTYFIHLKKNDINNIEDILKLKNLIDPTMSDDSYELRIMNKSDLENIKKIGKNLKSNIDTTCAKCDKIITKGLIFKELDCKHRFHKKCIEEHLENDIYKKCIICNVEHITTNI